MLNFRLLVLTLLVSVLSCNRNKKFANEFCVPKKISSSELIFNGFEKKLIDNDKEAQVFEISSYKNNINSYVVVMLDKHENVKEYVIRLTKDEFTNLVGINPVDTFTFEFCNNRFNAMLRGDYVTCYGR